jgi:hypothetical protein
MLSNLPLRSTNFLFDAYFLTACKYVPPLLYATCSVHPIIFGLTILIVGLLEEV